MITTALQTVVVTRKLVHLIISCTKTMFISAIAQMTIIDLEALDCIPRHSTAFQRTQLHSQGLILDSDRLSMEGPYEPANRQHRLTAWIEGYIKTPSVTKIVGNSFYIVFSILISKVMTFMYEIRHLNPLTQHFLLSIAANTIFPIITQKM
jgi:hypothetical protein